MNKELLALPRKITEIVILHKSKFYKKLKITNKQRVARVDSMADPTVLEMAVQLVEDLLDAQQPLVDSYYQLQFLGMELHQARQK